MTEQEQSQLQSEQQEYDDFEKEFRSEYNLDTPSTNTEEPTDSSTASEEATIRNFRIVQTDSKEQLTLGERLPSYIRQYGWIFGVPIDPAWSTPFEPGDLDRNIDLPTILRDNNIPEEDWSYYSDCVNNRMVRLTTARLKTERRDREIISNDDFWPSLGISALATLTDPGNIAYHNVGMAAQSVVPIPALKPLVYGAGFGLAAGVARYTTHTLSEVKDILYESIACSLLSAAGDKVIKTIRRLIPDKDPIKSTAEAIKRAWNREDATIYDAEYTVRIDPEPTAGPAGTVNALWSKVPTSRKLSANMSRLLQRPKEQILILFNSFFLLLT